MINPELLFISFVFLLLVGTAFWIKTPKIAVPLGIIYLVFIISNTGDSRTKLKDENLEDSYRDNNQLLENQNYDKSKGISNNILVEPVEPKLEPKPLTFDSGRTKKQKERIAIAEKSFSIEKDKVIIDKNIEKNTKNKIRSDLTVKDIKTGEELTANYNLYTYPKTGVGLQMI